MSTITISGASRRELATRINGGLKITLYWDSRDNSTSIGPVPNVHHCLARARARARPRVP